MAARRDIALCGLPAHVYLLVKKHFQLLLGKCINWKSLAALRAIWVELRHTDESRLKYNLSKASGLVARKRILARVGALGTRLFSKPVGRFALSPKTLATRPY